MALYYLANSKPTKKKILDLVVPHVSPKWYELGVTLLKEEQESQLDVIQSNYSNDNKTCCREMFWYWLRSDPDANWYQLIECLKSPAVELYTLAAEIEKKFAAGMYSVPSTSLLQILYVHMYVPYWLENFSTHTHNYLFGNFSSQRYLP